jgi:hypothetical protein
MTTLEQIREHLLLNKDVLKSGGVAKRANISPSTLNKFIEGEKHRHLTDAQVERLVPVLENIRFESKNFTCSICGGVNEHTIECTCGTPNVKFTPNNELKDCLHDRYCDQQTMDQKCKSASGCNFKA